MFPRGFSLQILLGELANRNGKYFPSEPLFELVLAVLFPGSLEARGPTDARIL